MIPLRLKVDPPPIIEPLVVRLRDDGQDIDSAHDAALVTKDGTVREYDYMGFSLVVHAAAEVELDGDVLLILPHQPSAHRLIRAASKHNTLLVTEQCDQLCAMCSQPPKKLHADLFDEFAIAAELAPREAYIGISGGEPLLHKGRLFDFLERMTVSRPDLRFHVLTNGQHFEPEDMRRLTMIGLDRILWGIPLYSHRPTVHDELVGKAGAFERLERSMALLAATGASIELRTVVTRRNWAELPELAGYVATSLPFIHVWAIMQLERIGYGRMNWATLFQDTSRDFLPARSAITLAAGRGIDVALYNFPLCSVPQDYRRYAVSAISDWKRRYLDFCDGCSARSSCGGFFEWYSHNEGFSALGRL